MLRRRMGDKPSTPGWDFVRRWRPKEGFGSQVAWAALEEWREVAGRAAAAAELELAARVRRWQGWLEPLGEVSSMDWRRFRPLRLSREEAWTDWLAHLLEHSVSGVLAEDLLAGHEALPPVEFKRLNVAREVCSSEGERRADLIIEWKTAVAHVEVKVGDQDFEKVFETGRLLEEAYGRRRAWADYILLPPEDLEKWLEVAAVAGPNERSVKAVTWADVAGGLRRAMRSGAESLPWRTWAHSYCGAAEQRLLGCLPADARAAVGPGVLRLSLALAQTDVMTKGER